MSDYFVDIFVPCLAAIAGWEIGKWGMRWVFAWWWRRNNPLEVEIYSPLTPGQEKAYGEWYVRTHGKPRPRP